MTHYKFVSWDVPAFETILTGRIPAALLAADNGNLQPLMYCYVNPTTDFLLLVWVGLFLWGNLCPFGRKQNIMALLKCTH